MVTSQRELLKRDVLLRPYRALHGRIFDGSAERKVRTLLFTANHAGEGCSTLAGNLAIYLSQAGPERVLLLELDVLHPARRPVVPAPRAVGIAEVLAGEVKLEEAVHQVPGTNLHVLACGTPNEGLATLFSERAIGELMQRLKSEHHYVVGDGPTVGGVPPVASLAPHFDGVALVVQANRTRRQVVSRSIESLKAASDNFLGLVMNQRRFFIPGWIYSRL